MLEEIRTVVQTSRNNIHEELELIIAGDFNSLLRQVLVQPKTRLLALELPSEQQATANGDPPAASSIRRFRETNSSEL